MRALVGYSGFVGGNLAATGDFPARYNSRNITEAFDTRPELLYFCGIGAQKFLANQNPAMDWAVIEEAIVNIRRIAPRNMVLISTVDVYPNPVGVDERAVPEADRLQAYGYNRLRFEAWVAETFGARGIIVRLPALYGLHLKKNFVYDMIHMIPAMLKAEKLRELDAAYLLEFYEPAADGFYRLRALRAAQRGRLRRYFEQCGFSALNFTDSRAEYQYYNLAHLYRQIEQARGMGVTLLNVATQPVGASEIYERIHGRAFVNHLDGPVARYDFRSLWAEQLGGRDGYLFDREDILADLECFIRRQIAETGV